MLHRLVLAYWSVLQLEIEDKISKISPSYSISKPLRRLGMHGQFMLPQHETSHGKCHSRRYGTAPALAGI
jgi:hypothetical protein